MPCTSKHLSGYQTLRSRVLYEQNFFYGGCCNGAALPSGEPTADAELQRPAAAALANLCSDPSLAQQLVGSGGMSALIELANSPDRDVQVRSHLPPINLTQTQHHNNVCQSAKRE